MSQQHGESRSRQQYVHLCIDNQHALPLKLPYVLTAYTLGQVVCMSTMPGSEDIALFSGCLDLVYTTGLSGKVEGLRMMAKVESGSHLGMSLVHCQKVSALMLEPVSTGVLPHSQHAVYI